MSAPRLETYAFALAICIGAALLSWLLGAPSSCFHLAIVICCLYGGEIVGLVATGVSILSFDYFFLNPHLSFLVERSAYPRFVAFIATAVCINLVIAAKQRGDRARREVEEQYATERQHARAAQDALQKMQVRLARASQIATLGEASASIAHEINQPLTGIIANTHLCFESLSSDGASIADARLLLEEILASGYHATEVVQRMRTLFKGGTLEKTTLDINEVAREVISLMRSEAAKRSVDLEADLETALPMIVGDRVQIQQVLVNLCINGFDAMDSLVDRPRKLSVRTRVHGSDAIRLEVRDNGIGLPDPDRIFEPFFTTKPNGMGMGLPICRSIIELHDGHLWPRSDEAPGTTFCFTLPVPDPRTSELQRSGRHPSEQAPTGCAGLRTMLF